MQTTARNHRKTHKLEYFVRTLKSQLPDLASRYNVKALALFGSYVRGEQKSRSDLDVLVEFTETPDIFQFMELEQHLADVLGVKVELVSRKALKGRIGQRIVDELVLI
jgi:uncharacterized protein